jgi:menaquinone-dependent protoporphyrinogen oxidase
MRRDEPPPRVGVIYGTTEGHTRKVGAHVARIARAEGAVAEVLEDVAAAPLQEGRWDAVIVGASVHQGHHQTSTTALVKANLGALERLPSAFLSVSLSAAVAHPVHQREAQGYIDAFLADTAWRPWATLSVAGALRHAEYDYFKRLVLELLGYQLGGGTVSQRDVVYTDWEQLDAFVRSFLVQALAAPRLPLDA